MLIQSGTLITGVYKRLVCSSEPDLLFRLLFGHARAAETGNQAWTGSEAFNQNRGRFSLACLFDLGVLGLIARSVGLYLRHVSQDLSLSPTVPDPNTPACSDSAMGTRKHVGILDDLPQAPRASGKTF